ncbi:MAG: hypothetical protein E7496_04965 [Ruminococcus sp.]|nr:hypothetical protein [Ruminococcus sp.]
MKNTRKVFAGLTALCCMGTLLTAFPVSAESDFNPDETNNFFIVDGTKGNSTMMKWWHYGEDYTYGDLLRIYPEESFSYGDVLTYDGEYTILETYPAQLGGNAGNLRKVGTCEDFFEMKDLTITYAESLEGADVFKNFRLSDSHGTPYTYTQDYTNVDYEISLEQAEVGDVYTFACYRNSALLPVAKSETASVSQTAEDISQPFTAEIMDETLGGCVMTLVKSDYLEESENWNAEYFSQEYGITNLKEIKSIFIDEFSNRRCVFFYPTDDTPETALEVAQKLYDTGLFYSVDLDAKTYLATEEETTPTEDISLPFEVRPDANYFGGMVTTVLKYDYRDEAENWNTEYFTDTLGITEIKSADIWPASEDNERRMIVFYLTDYTKETAFATAQKLYNTGLFYDIDMNWLEGNASVTPDGDADGSGTLDILDVITVNKAILGKEDISPDRIPYIDFNGNGVPDSEDSLVMMKMIVGLV